MCRRTGTPCQPHCHCRGPTLQRMMRRVTDSPPPVPDSVVPGYGEDPRDEFVTEYVPRAPRPAPGGSPPPPPFHKSRTLEGVGNTPLPPCYLPGRAGR